MTESNRIVVRGQILVFRWDASLPTRRAVASHAAVAQLSHSRLCSGGMPGRTTSTSGAVEDGRTKRPAAAAASAAAAAAAGARPSSVRLRIAGCSNAALNGIYNYVEQHEGWPRWKGERGYHLYRSKQCGRWVINRDFQPEQNLALANIKMAALPVGRCTWRCLLPQQAWGDQII
jgi:hypothetical protein